MAEPIEELRELATTAPPDGTQLAPYLEKVRSHAYRITDDDVAELKRSGIAEDAIFEATVAVAAAEGLRRLDAAEAAIG